MRWAALGCCVLMLAGCEHYIDLTADDFRPGKASPQQFARDNATCQDKGAVAQSEAGGNGDPHGYYNRAYRACMSGLGYRPTSPVGFGDM